MGGRASDTTVPRHIGSVQMIESYEERAAIMEHDGGMTKEAAESAALEDIKSYGPYTYKEGTVLFSAEDKIENIELARQHIKRFGLKSDDVKITRIKNDDQARPRGIYVITKRDIQWPPKA